MTPTLNKHDIQKLEEFWSKHKENQRLLKFREFEILSPYQEEVDENAGIKAGYGISNPTERNAMLLSEDKLYQNLKQIVQAVEDLYQETDEDTRKIVDMRYWDNENNCYEWEEIADKLYVSRSKVLRKRNSLLDETAERIGWV